MKKQPIITGAVVGPYSPAVKTDNLIFVSGQIPSNPKAGGAFPEGIEAQASQSLENVAALLREAGASMDNVVKTTIFLTDINEFDVVNRVYAAYFTQPYPARSCVAVKGLPKGALIEIEAIAAV